MLCETSFETLKKILEKHLRKSSLISKVEVSKMELFTHNFQGFS